MKTNKKNTESNNANAVVTQSAVPQTENMVTVIAPETTGQKPFVLFTAGTPDKAETVEIPLDRVELNPDNPRSKTNPETIKELAENILHNGLIQPITVREWDDKYLIICGERRYKAVALLGWPTITAIVRNVDDATAYALAISENLHREDINPMDAALAYKNLMERDGSTAEEIALKYGKNRDSVYKTLKLNDLIPDIQKLVRAEILSAGCAVVVSRYAQELQKTICNDHLRKDGTGDWVGIPPNALLKKIDNQYTNELGQYDFDQTECVTCNKNAVVGDMFRAQGDCGRCTDRKCLDKKMTAFVLGTVKELIKKHPAIKLIGDEYDIKNNEMHAKLAKAGHEFADVHTWNLSSFRSKPSAPRIGNFATAEEYAKAREIYQAELQNYRTAVYELLERGAKGETTVYANFTNSGVSLYCKDKKTKATTAKTKTDAEMVDYLKGKKQRNNEIKEQKIQDAAKKFLSDATIPMTAWTADEETMFYALMLRKLRKQHNEFVGHKAKGSWSYYRIDESECVKIAQMLTDEQKAVVRRDYIYDCIREYSTECVAGKMVIPFTERHFAEQYTELSTPIATDYGNKNKRLDERIGAHQYRIETVELDLEQKAKTEKKVAKGKPERVDTSAKSASGKTKAKADAKHKAKTKAVAKAKVTQTAA